MKILFMVTNYSIGDEEKSYDFQREKDLDFLPPIGFILFADLDDEIRYTEYEVECYVGMNLSNSLVQISLKGFEYESVEDLEVEKERLLKLGFTYK